MAEDIREELDKLLSHGDQIWLFGAGTSFDANLPLVVGLTTRVREQCATKTIDRQQGAPLNVGAVIDALAIGLSANPTIEVLLDQLADHFSMASRATANIIGIGSGVGAINVRADELAATRKVIVEEIRDALRWGYCHNDDPAMRKIGKLGNSIVEIDKHLTFVDTLFGQLHAGRAARLKPVEFFTVNYDTLIEDAFALRGISYSDGFAGGAVGYWDPTHLGKAINGNSIRATLTKLHGSIDWAYLPESERIVRRRIGDLYPANGDEVLIYPQASKYDFARREPFDTLFQRFRDSLSRSTAQVLIVCGYAFGDQHVDAVVEQAMSRASGGGLTIIAFAKQRTGKLEQWSRRPFGERVYVVAEDGIWRGQEGPFLIPQQGTVHDWWKFSGMTKFLSTVR